MYQDMRIIVSLHLARKFAFLMKKNSIAETNTNALLIEQEIRTDLGGSSKQNIMCEKVQKILRTARYP